MKRFEGVANTLFVPLVARIAISKEFPEYFTDKKALELEPYLPEDAAKGSSQYSNLASVARYYNMDRMVTVFAEKNPECNVVYLGAGLETAYDRLHNDLSDVYWYECDLPDVIGIRNELLGTADRETNIGCDLNDHHWMDLIDGSKGAVFFAAGVLYYLKKEDVISLTAALADRFPGAVIVFDSCNEFGAKLMRKTWLKEAGISDVSACFSLNDKPEIEKWSDRFKTVTEKSYMRGYRDIWSEVGLFHKLMLVFCDRLVRMKIVKIKFKKDA